MRSAKPATTAYRLYDRDGLYVEVATTGSKYWRLKYRFGGKEKRLALGVFDVVTLAMAREKTAKARKQLVNGVDPGEQRKARKQTETATVRDAFEAVAREWHSKFSPDWPATHANKLIRRLEIHAFPFIGGKAISGVSAADVLALLQKPESRGELETTHGVRVVVGQVCRYAVATGRAASDPTPTLRGAIKPHRNKQMAPRPR